MGGMVTFQADVADYDPADLGDLVGGVGWTVDSSRVAVLVHDMLPYYLQVLLSGVKARVLHATAAVAEWALGRDVPVMVSGPRPADHPSKRGLGGSLWGQGPTADEAIEVAVPSLASRSVTRIRSVPTAPFMAPTWRSNFAELAATNCWWSECSPAAGYLPPPTTRWPGI